MPYEWSSISNDLRVYKCPNRHKLFNIVREPITGGVRRTDDGQLDNKMRSSAFLSSAKTPKTM